MPDIRIKRLESINDGKAEILLLATIDVANHLGEDKWEDKSSVWMRNVWMKKVGFTREDMQELRAKLVEFRLRARRIDRR